MLNTKLILIEGIPGSGKSTLAQFIERTLTRQGIACQWWYEEEKGHPLYVFHDLASLQETVQALHDGWYREVVEAALEKWKLFVERLQSLETVGILDGCLFGYLTWSLFPLDIPVAEIQGYLARVEQIIRPLQPCVIYLYQQDVARALAKICQRRGGATESRFIAQAVESAYGKRMGLQGFAGIVTYWQDFRALVEETLAQLAVSKLSIENSAGDWDAYERAVLEFLQITIEKDVIIFPSHLTRFTGTYFCEEDGNQQTCQVLFEDACLVVDGIAQVWPKTRLIPYTDNMFAVESLPFLVTFEEDAEGIVTVLKITGPELLAGKVERLFVRML
jgi:thymidylate kinase